MSGQPFDFRHIDVSQYGSWPKVVADNGHVYYVPPGGDGYLYDPFLNHFFSDPRAAIKANKTAQDAATSAAKDANSPVRQFGTIAGVTGLTAGIPIAATHLWPSAVEQAAAAKLAGTAAPQVAPQVVATAPVTTAPVTTAPTSFAGAATAPSTAATVVGENADGTLILSDGTTAAADAGATSAAPVAADAAAPGLASGYGIGLGPLAAVVAGTYLGGKSAFDMLSGNLKPWSQESFADKAGRVTLGIATGGLSEIGNALFGGHESTRDVQKKHTDNLTSQAPDDPAWQTYVSGIRAQNDSGPPDPSKPFGDTKGNTYATFNDYKAGGLDAANLTGVYGNLNAYGPDWAKLTEAQRQQITQANINSGIYDSKSGEVVITDADQAKKNYDSVMSGKVVPANTGNGTPFNNVQPVTVTNQPAAQPATANIPRSMTVSPGIGMNGQRIDYGKALAHRINQRTARR